MECTAPWIGVGHQEEALAVARSQLRQCPSGVPPGVAAATRLRSMYRWAVTSSRSTQQGCKKQPDWTRSRRKVVARDEARRNQ